MADSTRGNVKTVKTPVNVKFMKTFGESIKGYKPKSAICKAKTVRGGV